MRQPATAETLVARTAKALGKLSLEQEDGAYLGAEDDLLARLGVSRPTLRQAAKIAESEGLVSVRRGTRGGFYAHRPDAADAVRALARYLRINGATIADVVVVNRGIAREAAALAAKCTDPELRERLARFQQAIPGNDTPGTIIRAETELARTLAEMSGNPAIKLLMEIGYTFGMGEEVGSLYATAEDRALARRLQGDLCSAVLAGDAEIASLLMQRRSEAMQTWLTRKAAAND